MAEESSLLDLLMQRSSGTDRLMSLLPMIQAQQGGLPGMPGTPTSLTDFTAGAGAGAPQARRIGRWIENRPGTNFQVTGLEGFQGTGQVSSGHIDNSQHYTGQAGDVSYLGGPRFGNETEALNWLYGKLGQKFGPDLTELLWQVDDHYDHLHYGTRPGG